jgi:membrane fusion protein (multidrug efflux system)
MSESTQADKRVMECTPKLGGGTGEQTGNGNGRKGPRKRYIALVIFLIVAVLAGIGGGIYWMYARQFEETDDAAVDGAVTPMSPKVAGLVQDVEVKDNQWVNAGDVLVKIDPRDFDNAVQEATANVQAAEARLQAAQTNVQLVEANTAATLGQADAQVKQEEAGVQEQQAAVTMAESQVASAQADVAAAQAEATRRQADLKRYEALDPRAVSQQARDAAKAAADAADAALTAAQKREVAAEAAVKEARSQVEAAQSKVTWATAGVQAAETGPQQLATAQAQVRNAQAALAQANAALAGAQLNLGYTTVRAPIAGRITRKAVQPGQYVQVGQLLFVIVPKDVWVTANFKETQLDRMHAGQPAEITVDMYPGRVFKGHVESIQAGTGARFSMLPPENATGNFVKIVQRVPVKIVFDEDPAKLPLLGPGMSAVPRVRVMGPGSDATTQPSMISTTSAGD